jgi:hypothetical protein
MFGWTCSCMPNRNRTWKLLAVGVLLLVGMVVVLAAWPARPKVRLGMTRAQVEEALGQGGQEYHVDLDQTGAAWRRREYPISTEPWETYYVWYSPDQIVVGGCQYRPPSALETVLSKVATAFGMRYKLNGSHQFR